MRSCFKNWLRKRLAFTLIELLVVISIISMLMAILMPSLGKAREQARRVVCMANLHSLGQSIFLYSQNNGGSLIPGDNPVSWDVWGLRTSGTCLGQYKQVNLGYLLSYGTLPVPTNNDSVFFCPSTRSSNGGKACEDFLPGWEASDTILLSRYPVSKPT